MLKGALQASGAGGDGEGMVVALARTGEDQSKKVTFWNDPRRTSARRWIFYVHFYAGLTAGLLFSVIGITGSIIVFVDALRVLEVPGSANVRPIGRSLPLETLFQKVKEVRPHDTFDSFSSASRRDSFESVPNKALNFLTKSPQGEQIHTFIDQYTGKILYQDDHHRVLQTIYDLHADLLGGKRGRTINAWFAMLLSIVSTAGLLLWWRGRKYWRMGFEYRFQASWKRQTLDLHSLGGFLFFLPLLMMALTGIYFSYEHGFAAVATALTRGPAPAGTGWPSGGVYHQWRGRTAGDRDTGWHTVPVPRASIYPAKWQPLDDILRNAEQKAPDCKPTITYFPVPADGSFHIRFRCPSEPYHLGLSFVYIDPPTAQVLGVDRFDQAPLGIRLIRLTSPIHFGDLGGLSTRILWVVLGLTPGMFFVTALLMWWNRSLSQAWRRRQLRMLPCG